MTDAPTNCTVENIKKFKVKDTWKDFEVILEVRLDRLTIERANMINAFWTGAEDRLSEENGDAIRTVVRLAGLEVICEMLEDRGGHFTATCHSYPAKAATKKLHCNEGWGGEIEGDEFGWCGIRVVAADVQLPGFEELALAEVSNA